MCYKWARENLPKRNFLLEELEAKLHSLCYDYHTEGILYSEIKAIFDKFPPILEMKARAEIELAGGD